MATVLAWIPNDLECAAGTGHPKPDNLIDLVTVSCGILNDPRFCFSSKLHVQKK